MAPSAMRAVLLLCAVSVDEAHAGWSCPSSWVHGTEDGAPGAKEFTAINNVLRCVHESPAVQWDHDVYVSAKKWADHTGEDMTHSKYDSEYRDGDTGENLAGTYKESTKPGIDSAHMWYQELIDCNLKPSCFQSFNAGHFTAMIWKDVKYIAFADPTGKLSVGRYKAKEGGMPPNMDGNYEAMVPPPKNQYGDCIAKVLQCPTFEGVKSEDLQGCGSQWVSSSDGGARVEYTKTCATEYGAWYDANIKLPSQWPYASVGLMALGALTGAVALVARRVKNGAAHHPPEQRLVDVESDSID